MVVPDFVYRQQLSLPHTAASHCSLSCCTWWEFALLLDKYWRKCENRWMKRRKNRFLYEIRKNMNRVLQISRIVGILNCLSLITASSLWGTQFLKCFLCTGGNVLGFPSGGIIAATLICFVAGIRWKTDNDDKVCYAWPLKQLNYLLTTLDCVRGKSLCSAMEAVLHAAAVRFNRHETRLLHSGICFSRFSLSSACFRTLDDMDYSAHWMRIDWDRSCVQILVGNHLLVLLRL